MNMRREAFSCWPVRNPVGNSSPLRPYLYCIRIEALYEEHDNASPRTKTKRKEEM